MKPTASNNAKSPAGADHGSLAGELDEGVVTNGAPTVDLPRIERAVREILAAVGENPDREGLRETPARVARMYQELFRGLHTDPRVHLQKFFTEKYDEMVLVRDIAFNSMCEHHMLPFVGHAHIGYLPSGKVVGLSKLARTVEVYARRPQMQERLTSQVADAIMTHLQPKGVGVVVEAEHLCMSMRGVSKPGAETVTSAVRGILRTDEKTRNECFSLITGAGR